MGIVNPAMLEVYDNIPKELLEKVEDVLHEGQVVKVKLTGIDERGRLSLSIKDVEKA